MYFAVNPTDAQVLSQTLQQQMATSDPNRPWLALVDQAFDYGRRRRLAWSGECWPLYYQGQLANLAALSPLLLPLESQALERRQQQLISLLEHCHGRPMLSFIHSAVPAAELRLYWQASLQPQTSDGQRMLLRFADTRILNALPSALSAASWQRLHADSQQWLSIQRDGSWLVLPRPRFDPSQAPEPHWQLTEQEEQRLLHASLPDTLANALDEQMPNLLRQQPGLACYHQLKQVSELTQRASIESFPDQLLLAVATLTSQGEILQHPELSATLAAYSQQPQGWGQALAALLPTGD